MTADKDAELRAAFEKDWAPALLTRDVEGFYDCADVAIAWGYYRAGYVEATRASARIAPEHRAVIEEAAQVFESGAAHNLKMGRTVFWRTQQDRADRLRAVIAAAAPEEKEKGKNE